MYRRGKVTLLAVACILALAACTTESPPSTPAQEGSVCLKTCEGALDECSRECRNAVDNSLCSRECLDQLDHCKKRCQ